MGDNRKNCLQPLVAVWEHPFITACTAKHRQVFCRGLQATKCYTQLKYINNCENTSAGFVNANCLFLGFALFAMMMNAGVREKMVFSSSSDNG